MKIALFVHELNMEVGHGRATIEIIRNLSRGSVEELRVVCYQHSDLGNIFSSLECPMKVYRLRLKKIFPFLLKDFAYQLYSYFIATFFLPRDFVKLSVGTAYVGADIINVQFVHGQWRGDYFKYLSASFLRRSYKKILHHYFAFLENYLYRRKNIKVYCLAQFIVNYLKDTYGIEEQRIKLIYSGVNLTEFSLSGLTREDLFEDLTREYPQLKKINLRFPTYLFVGAFERKGLDEAIKILGRQDNKQLVVIGRAERGSEWSLENYPWISYVPFTNKVRKFYEFCDCFIFPTRYEPFGLVLIEAFAMGMFIITKKKKVGAVEIIGSEGGVYTFDSADDVNLDHISVIDLAHRRRIINERASVLQSYSWEQASQNLFQFIGPSSVKTGKPQEFFGR